MTHPEWLKNVQTFDADPVESNAVVIRDKKQVGAALQTIAEGIDALVSEKCAICGGPMDAPGKPESRNCGGDCLKCMAEAGDPECLEVMSSLKPNTPQP